MWHPADLWGHPDQLTERKALNPSNNSAHDETASHLDNKINTHTWRLSLQCQSAGVSTSNPEGHQFNSWLADQLSRQVLWFISVPKCTPNWNTCIFQNEFFVTSHTSIGPNVLLLHIQIYCLTGNYMAFSLAVPVSDITRKAKRKERGRC